MILSKAGNIVDDVPLHDYENHHLSTIILLVITRVVRAITQCFIFEIIITYI
jgi:hypothetical protein